MANVKSHANTVLRREDTFLDAHTEQNDLDSTASHAETKIHMRRETKPHAKKHVHRLKFTCRNLRRDTKPHGRHDDTETQKGANSLSEICDCKRERKYFI